MILMFYFSMQQVWSYQINPAAYIFLLRNKNIISHFIL